MYIVSFAQYYILKIYQVILHAHVMYVMQHLPVTIVTMLPAV